MELLGARRRTYEHTKQVARRPVGWVRALSFVRARYLCGRNAVRMITVKLMKSALPMRAIVLLCGALVARAQSPGMSALPATAPTALATPAPVGPIAATAAIVDAATRAHRAEIVLRRAY